MVCSRARPHSTKTSALGTPAARQKETIPMNATKRNRCATASELWMRPDSLVLEISTGFRCHCYRALADFAGHAFESLEASSREPEKLASAVLHRLGLG